MYRIYIGKILLPVAPESIETGSDGNNETIELINGNEINIVKKPHLKTVKFKALLPNYRYPFAYYKGGKFYRAKWYVHKIKDMQLKKKIFKFKVIRKLPNGKRIWRGQFAKATIEDFSYTDDAGNLGQDIELSLTIKQFRKYKTKKRKVKTKENVLIDFEEFKEDIRSETDTVKRYCNGLPESVAKKIRKLFKSETRDDPTPQGIKKARARAKDRALNYWVKGKIK